MDQLQLRAALFWEKLWIGNINLTEVLESLGEEQFTDELTLKNLRRKSSFSHKTHINNTESAALVISCILNVTN